MANNPAQDRYNGPGLNITEFESFRFSEIPDGQLFWRFNDDRPNNYAFRKLNDDAADNAFSVKGQVNVTVERNDLVYQKI